jgi:protein phosphatase
MQIKLQKPYALNEQGGRGNNEDSVYPAIGKSQENNRLFLVCDGVGGADKGEVASGILCAAIPEYFEDNAVSIVDDDYLRNAVIFAEERMDAEIAQNPQCKGMASTLTLLYFNPTDAIIAWAGDSRIYQIRNGQIVFKTKDHSLVNYLVSIGEITEDEAIHHPRKNQILKAIQGSDTPVRIETAIIEDVLPGDYFFMCTDGVLENIDDEKLTLLFSDLKSEEHVIAQVLDLCKDKTKDNFSLYLIPVDKQAQLNDASVNDSKKPRRAGIIMLIIMAFLLVIYFLMKVLFP